MFEIRHYCIGLADNVTQFTLLPILGYREIVGSLHFHWMYSYSNNCCNLIVQKWTKISKRCRDKYKAFHFQLPRQCIMKLFLALITNLSSEASVFFFRGKQQINCGTPYAYIKKILSLLPYIWQMPAIFILFVIATWTKWICWMCWSALILNTTAISVIGRSIT